MLANPFANIARHDERLIDESIEETFPASDPTTTARPGSLVAARYPAGRARRAAVQVEAVLARRKTPSAAWLLTACAVLVAAAFAIGALTRRA